MILVACTAAITPKPNFRSRSKIRYWGELSKGNASRNCWVIQPLVGCFVTLNVQDAPPIMTDDEEAVLMLRAAGTGMPLCRLCRLLTGVIGWEELE
jgi:hypothetical protein